MSTPQIQVLVAAINALPAEYRQALLSELTVQTRAESNLQQNLDDFLGEARKEIIEKVSIVSRISRKNKDSAYIVPATLNELAIAFAGVAWQLQQVNNLMEQRRGTPEAPKTSPHVTLDAPSRAALENLVLAVDMAAFNFNIDKRYTRTRYTTKSQLCPYVWLHYHYSHVKVTPKPKLHPAIVGRAGNG